MAVRMFNHTTANIKATYNCSDWVEFQSYQADLTIGIQWRDLSQMHELTVLQKQRETPLLYPGQMLPRELWW